MCDAVTIKVISSGPIIYNDCVPCKKFILFLPLEQMMLFK